MNQRSLRLQLRTTGVSGLRQECDRSLEPQATATANSIELPRISPRLLSAFAGYSRWYAGRHFHSIRLSRSGPIPLAGRGSMVIHVNHASWWDPLICLLLARQCFPEKQIYAPIDAEALERYRFFKRLGFFGVERNTRRGARQFLRTARTILDDPTNMLWVTPQGRFADARERPPRYEHGLAHVARQCPETTFVPLAIEFVFWEERLPEVLLKFGKPVNAAELIREHEQPQAITGFLEQQMMATQDALAAESQARDPEAFEMLLRGGAGVAFFYDAWRRCLALLAGRKFQSEHGHK